MRHTHAAAFLPGAIGNGSDDAMSSKWKFTTTVRVTARMGFAREWVTLLGWLHTDGQDNGMRNPETAGVL